MHGMLASWVGWVSVVSSSHCNNPLLQPVPWRVAVLAALRFYNYSTCQGLLGRAGDLLELIVCRSPVQDWATPLVQISGLAFPVWMNFVCFSRMSILVQFGVEARVSTFVWFVFMILQGTLSAFYKYSVNLFPHACRLSEESIPFHSDFVELFLKGNVLHLSKNLSESFQVTV